MPRKEEPKEILGLNRITKKRILELCKKDKLYQTPELNEVLYLHYQGFEFIECLEDYTELKCLWLECNAISEIQGLEKLTKLKCLFLQSNLIRKIENLEFCKELDTVNLSQNHIRKIENCGFEVLPVLNTLNLSSNYLKDCESLMELESCKNLSVLDLSNNRIDDILVVKIFGRMPELKVLVLQGNPVVSKIPQYRKTLILECKKLTYLDSRPVFPKDRACAEAWKRGGYEEERRENERWNRKERKKMRDGVNATIQLRNKNRKPEDQISLILTSDSEDDLNMQKKNLEIPVKSDVSIDSIWDEVSEDKSLERSLISNITCESNINQSCFSCESANDEEYKENDESIEVEHMQKEEKNQEVEDKEENLETEITDKSSDMVWSNSDISLDSNTVSQEKYQPIADAIEKISKPENYSEYSSNKVQNISENEEHDEDNYQPLKEMEETMKIFLKYECEEQSSSQQTTKMELKKPILELEKEQEHFKINQQLMSNFEELSNNMNVFVEQLDKDQAERQEIIKALFDKSTAAKESSCESSDSDGKDDLDSWKFERMVDQLDKESKLENEITKHKVPHINVNDKFCNNDKIELMEIAELNEITRDIENIANITTKDTKIFEQEQCNKISEVNHFKGLSESYTRDNFKYVPIDISLLTRKSNEALNSLERESKELKKLLQELENKNEDLFKDINIDQKIHRDEIRENKEHVCDEDTMVQKSNCENIPTKVNYESNQIKQNYVVDEEIIEKINEKEVKQVVYTIIEEILEALEQKTFDTIEFHKDFELSPQPQKQITSESVPEFLYSFNRFFKSLESKNAEMKKTDLEKLDKTQQKSLIFKELSKQTNLKQFNNDIHENLDAQLEKIRRDQSTKVQRMVHRVYAQKDRYNDTLELVDGKLMVRNKNTNELQKLSEMKIQDSSDSESDYDTAQSDEDEKDEHEKLKKNSQCKSIPFKTIARKSCEDITIKALIENNPNRSNDEDEESNDEFYSLDAEDTPNLYNIDKEFFNKLTLDNLNLSQIDENHILQCARSYEELKHYLTLSKEERYLTEEENELLESMIERKYVQIKKNSENLPKISQGNINLCEEEQLWFNKTSSKSVLESNSNESVSKELTVDLKTNKEAIQLLEYKKESNNDLYFGKQLEEKTLTNTDNDKVDGKIPAKDDDENIMKQIFLKKISEKKEFMQRRKYDKKKIPKTFLGIERHCEEEKNEFENNVDFESATTNVKLDCQANRETVEEKFQTEANQKTELEVIVNEEHSDNSANNDNSYGVEVLECNLEIFDINDELVDTITVNAELKF